MSVATVHSQAQSSSSMTTTPQMTTQELEPVKNFLQGALNAHLKGSSAQYSAILSSFRSRDDQETLWKVILALNSFSSLLTQRSEAFRDLLTIIFTYDWRGESKVTQAILQLITNLVSCNAIFLSSAFSLFARSFLPQNIATAGIKEALTLELGQRETKQWIHQTIQTILKQVPVGQSVLLTTLYENFPHKRFSKQILSEYVTQLLTICDYLPALQYRILDLIIDRCLEIDVEIIIEESGDVRIQKNYEEEDDLYGDIFQLTGTDGTTGGDVNVSGYGQQQDMGGDDNKPRIPKEVCELADKLDAMLMLVVAFFQKQLTQQPQSSSSVPSSSSSSYSVPPSSSSASMADNESSTQRLYQHLMMIFEKRLLSAHKSKFVQFTIFFVTTKTPSFGEHLARRLYAIGVDKTQSSILRQAAIMYLASFTSRATFLSPLIVQEIVSNLIKWSTAYICERQGQTRILSRELIYSLQRDFGLTNMPAGQTYKDALVSGATAVGVGKGGTSNGGLFIDHIEYDDYGRLHVKEHTARQHEVLYAAIQSACYILCFYGIELASSLASDEYVKQCVEILFTSRFDPLRYTLKSVRNEFLKLALHVSLFSDECWECLSPDLLYVETDFTSDPLPLPIRHSTSSSSLHGAVGVGVGVGIGQNGNSNASLATGQVTTSTGITSHGTTSTITSTTSMLGPNTLESFFPFDPCLLQRLHQSIEHSYRSWKGVPGLEEDRIFFSHLFPNSQHGRSDDMPIPTIDTSYYGGDGYDGYDNASMVSSLAYTDGGMSMSMNSMPGERMMRAVAMSSSLGASHNLNVMRRNSYTQQQQPAAKRQGRDPFGEGELDDLSPTAPATNDDDEDVDEDDSDDDDLDEEDDDEDDDDEDEDVFGQGMEMSQPSQTNSSSLLSSSPRGSYFAQFAAMQSGGVGSGDQLGGQLPPRSFSSSHLSSMPLTADSLRAISQGLGGSTMLDMSMNERRPRMYSIGSTGSW